MHLKESEIKEFILGADHPMFARSLSNLANVYILLKNYQEAEEIYLRSIKICE